MSGIIADNVGRASGLVKAAAGGGKVLQVVQQYITTQYAGTSATFATISGFPAPSITPGAATSKILIEYSLSGLASNWGMIKIQADIGAAGYNDIGLGSGATGDQSNGHMGGMMHQGDDGVFEREHWKYLWSPSTTSACTFKLLQLSYNPTTIYLNRTVGNANYNEQGNTASSITLMEIGA